MLFKLEEIAEFQKGFAFKSKDFKESGVRIVKVSNLTSESIDFSSCVHINNELAEKYIKYELIKDDIIITTVGSWPTNPASIVGKVVKVPKSIEGALLNQNAVRIRANSSVNQEYLYYLLKSNNFKDYIIGTAQGSANQASITQKDIKNFKYDIPTLDEQKAIAKILSDLDEKIEINNKINDNLEKIAQAIFKQWFVDFEFPNEKGEPYKSSGGEMIESELGDIPKGWEIKSLLDIADYLNGLAMQKFRPDQSEKGIPVLKIKELRQGSTDMNSDLSSSKISKEYIIKDGDIIFSWSGSLLVDIWCGGKCGLNQHLFKVTSTNFEKWFYYLWTKYHLNKFIQIAKDKATTMGHIKRSDLGNSMILVPNEEILSKANLIFNPIIKKIIEIGVESRKLIKARDTLLPKLMSGEIRVPLEEN